MAGPMAALLILPLMLQTATAGTGVELSYLEVPKQCLQGPDYWCESEETSSLCMKEDYCMQLWQNTTAEMLIGSGAGEAAGNLKTPFGENKGLRRKDGTKRSLGVWGLKCKACKSLFKYLEKHVVDDESDEEIGSAVDVGCSKIPFLLKKLCKIVVKKFRNAIIEAIEEHEEPETFCAKLNLCSQSAKMAVELGYAELPEQCLQGPSFWCESKEATAMCKKEDYCTELQGNLAAELEASSRGRWEDATEEEEEEEKKKKKKKKKDKKRKKDKKGKKGKGKKKNKKRKDKTDPKCAGCTQIVKNLQNSVGEDPDDDTINTALDLMCDDVDDSIADICTTLKENNRDDLTEAVKNKDNPKDVCTQLQMCEGQDLEDSEGLPVPAPTVGPNCILCQAFTSFVKPLLIDNVQKENLGQVLADVCMEHFSNSTKCNNFLSTYGMTMKHVLLKPWDQITTCRAVGACEERIPGVKRAASLKALKIRVPVSW